LLIFRKIPVRRPILLWLKRFFALISFTLLMWLSLIVAGIFGYAVPWDPSLIVIGTRPPLWDRQIAIISGHAGFDSGAVCLDAQGQVTLTEAEVNRGVAEATARQLAELGATTLLLEEYDARLAGLEADLLLSLHADSCISASGFKAASYALSRIPITDARLLGCINRHFAEVTGLAEHPNTVTHDMTEYHAFKRIHYETPAAILEMGFLGGDQRLLTEEQDRVAQAIAQSARCFLAQEEETAATSDHSSEQSTDQPIEETIGE
jgi:N-acetylmuramoyl-L-alanine amidase